MRSVLLAVAFLGCASAALANTDGSAAPASTAPKMKQVCTVYQRTGEVRFRKVCHEEPITDTTSEVAATTPATDAKPADAGTPATPPSTN